MASRIGHLEDRTALAEVLADALLLGERILFGGGHGACASVMCGRAAANRGNIKLAVGSRWYCRHQHAFSRYFRLPTRTVLRTACFYNGQRPGAFAPSLRWSPACSPGDATAAYLTSTVAPAASRSFFIFSASSFDTPSFTMPPASVRSLASFRPRPVMARTALMTSTFLSPADFRMTLNSVCSSTGGGGGGRAGGSHDRGGGGDAELLFDGLHQLHHFHQRLGGDGVDDLLVGQGHCRLPLEMFRMNGNVVRIVRGSGRFGLRLGFGRRHRRHPAGRPRP